MNLNFYNPQTNGLEELQRSLQDQLVKLDELKKVQNIITNPAPVVNPNPRPQLDEKRYYLDCGNKEDWEQFLKVNYDITEKQIFDDYKLFLQAKAELNEDANREKLDKMKQKLTNKEGNNVQSIYNQPVQSVHNESVPVHQSNINNQQMDSNNVPTTTMLLPGINVPVTTKVNNLDGNTGGMPTMEQGTTTIDKKGAKHVR